MSKKKNRKPTEKRSSGSVAFLLSDEAYKTLCIPGYTPLSQVPEIMTAARRIAELIGSMTIHLMANEKSGDVRIVNELSRAIDIEPMPNMTRSTWIQAIVLTMLLYGDGNAIVQPHTYQGYLESLEPIAAERVTFIEDGFRDYKVMIDGKTKRPDSLCHFVYNPDRTYLWKGRGVTVALKEIADNLRQATKTTNAFMRSEWKPSVIIKVDAFNEDFRNPEKRKKILEEYVHPDEPGTPWVLPAEQFDVQQIKPLTLNDLAISNNVEIDKRTVASVMGVPPFLLGVGEYNKDAWNSFVQNTIRPITIAIQQELTKKLIRSPNMYLKFNVRSLMDWDIKTIYDVYGGMSDKGLATGNEVRELIGMAPLEGLDELRILENYIPLDKIGDQNKLSGG